jgi:hypothetical protein
MKLREIRDELAKRISAERGARMCCGVKDGPEAKQLGQFFAQHAWILGDMCLHNPEWKTLLELEEKRQNQQP